ncbi:MAG: 50S ribosomal protein L35 [Chlamydiales bacterium]
MPKMKTNKSIASRFKVTGRGKLLRKSPGRRHHLTKKSAERKRRLGNTKTVPETMLKMYKKMIGV